MALVRGSPVAVAESFPSGEREDSLAAGWFRLFFLLLSSRRRRRRRRRRRGGWWYADLRGAWRHFACTLFYRTTITTTTTNRAVGSTAVASRDWNFSSTSVAGGKVPTDAVPHGGATKSPGRNPTAGNGGRGKVRKSGGTKKFQKVMTNGMRREGFKEVPEHRYQSFLHS